MNDRTWTRWKAVRSLGELGLVNSRRALEAVIDDPEFQVRFETGKVLREGGWQSCHQRIVGRPTSDLVLF